MVKCEKQGAWRGGSTQVIYWPCDLRMLHNPSEHLSFSHLSSEIKEIAVLEHVLNRRTEHCTSHTNSQCPKALQWLKKKSDGQKECVHSTLLLMQPVVERCRFKRPRGPLLYYSLCSANSVHGREGGANR